MSAKQDPPSIRAPSRVPWSNDPQLADYYADHRDKPDDLYPSERRFLPWLATRVRNVVDVGCAAGGFCNIWRAYEPRMTYTGVDVSTALLRTARRLHPAVSFLTGDSAVGLPLRDRSAELVQALGWLHWEHDYPEALRELWRVASRYIFFDLRLVKGSADWCGGHQSLSFSESSSSGAIVPYLCVGWDTFASFLKDLCPITIFGYGYWGRPAATVTGVDTDVYFATFVVEKPETILGTTRPTVCVGPLPWPPSLSAGVSLVPFDQLERQAPPEGR